MTFSSVVRMSTPPLAISPRKGLHMKLPAVQSYGMKQLNVHDPDGYELCFQRPASTEAPRDAD
jgi:hypothetical protein